MSEYEIVLNAVLCLTCRKILHSVHRHDWVGCEHIFTDGGHDYIRRGGSSEDMKDISVYRRVSDGRILYSWQLPDNACVS